MDRMLYQSADQINGTAAHEKVDSATYSSRKAIMMGNDVYSEKYNIVGKIDIYDREKALLRERKKKNKQIYDGYVYQVYAQCFCLREMGYAVNSIELYSMDDHKTYQIALPENDPSMFAGFLNVISGIRNFRMEVFVLSNKEKCRHCIYEPACDKTLL